MTKSEKNQEPEIAEEVIANEEVELELESETVAALDVESEEPIVPERPIVTMSPEAVESRYQAFLEKIKRGGK